MSASATVVAFFNNKGGVGKTFLVYHLSWMYSDLGARVVAADLDPQANLTAAFLEDERLELLWPEEGPSLTVFACIETLIRRTGDVADPHLETIDDRLSLLAGDLSLSGFEEELSQEWRACADGKEGSFRVVSALWRVLQKAARHRADIVLVDLGSNLGSVNRAALIATDYVVVPVSPDLFSLQGLRNLGPTLRRWGEEWSVRLQRRPLSGLELPAGRMEPVGYVVMQHAVRLDRPVKAYDRWIARIPDLYRSEVLGEDRVSPLTVKTDPYCLALLKHYSSLMPLAQEARKPIFHLKPADGAIGGHMTLALESYKDFKRLAEAVAAPTGIHLPSGVTW